MHGHTPHGLENNFPELDMDAGVVIHYTCNPPSNKILIRNNISALGDKYGCCDVREVLCIPVRLYCKYGYLVNSDRNVLSIVSEHLLRRLT